MLEVLWGLTISGTFGLEYRLNLNFQNSESSIKFFRDNIYLSHNIPGYLRFWPPSLMFKHLKGYVQNSGRRLLLNDICYYRKGFLPQKTIKNTHESSKSLETPHRNFIENINHSKTDCKATRKIAKHFVKQKSSAWNIKTGSLCWIERSFSHHFYLFICLFFCYILLIVLDYHTKIYNARVFCVEQQCLSSATENDGEIKKKK